MSGEAKMEDEVDFHWNPANSEGVSFRKLGRNEVFVPAHDINLLHSFGFAIRKHNSFFTSSILSQSDNSYVTALHLPKTQVYGRLPLFLKFP
jgi:hypothetical protein